MAKIDSLEKVADALEASGYEPEAQNGAVSIGVGGSENPFVAVITLNDATSELVVTCQVAKLGDIDDDMVMEFCVACLDINTQIRPYAFATITASDNPDLDDPDSWPIVLTDSLPIGDLSDEELTTSIDSLWSALVAGAEVLRIGIGQGVR